MASTLFVSGVTVSAAPWFNDVDTAVYNGLTSVSGTNTITATGPTSMSAYATNQIFKITPAATNTGAATLNISSVGAKNIFFGGAACIGGELVSGVPALVIYDGTQFNIVGKPRITISAAQASMSGTEINFTGIPPGTKRITVMFKGVSISGTDDIIFQLGDSGGIEATGYLGSGSIMSAAVSSTAYTSGFGIVMGSAAVVLHGSITLNRESIAGFTWAASGVFASSDTARTFTTAGVKSTSAELDRVRVTTVLGSDSFDAGEISISYE